MCMMNGLTHDTSTPLIRVGYNGHARWPGRPTMKAGGMGCLMRISIRDVLVDAKHHVHLVTRDKDHVT